VNAKDRFGCTALHTASYCGDIDIARLLIRHGADVNATDEFGFTPLQDASDSGQSDIVRLLIQYG
jgi:ankyrin repeat protein